MGNSEGNGVFSCALGIDLLCRRGIEPVSEWRRAWKVLKLRVHSNRILLLKDRAALAEGVYRGYTLWKRGCMNGLGTASMRAGDHPVTGVMRV